jgi:hypothetical protein
MFYPTASQRSAALQEAIPFLFLLGEFRGPPGVPSVAAFVARLSHGVWSPAMQGHRHETALKLADGADF